MTVKLSNSSKYLLVETIKWKNWIFSFRFKLWGLHDKKNPVPWKIHLLKKKRMINMTKSSDSVYRLLLFSWACWILNSPCFAKLCPKQFSISDTRNSQYLNLVGINSQLIFYFCMETQGRSQDLNRLLKDIVQNFDDDVIVIMVTSLSWRWWKTRKVSCCLIILREESPKNPEVNIFIHWTVLLVRAW